jgi:type II secretory pathway pseudopilin PulG
MSRLTGHHRPPSPPRGFTLTELLLVISIIIFAIALMMPALVSARHEARRVVCLNNLHHLGILAQTYAQDDPRAQAVAVPYNGNEVALVDGIYDYGGNSASLDNPHDAAMTVWGPTSPNAGPNRPLNRLLFGPNAGEPNSKLFNCPGDEGWVNVPDNPRSVAYSAFIGQPFWRATGTSYRANACRAAAGVSTAPDAEWYTYVGLEDVFSMGPYLRSGSKIGNVSQVILFCESIMWQALWNSAENFGEGIADLPGWHGRMTRFNAALYDGHAATLTLTKDNTDFNPYGVLRERGPEWHFDTFPEPLIPDPPGR